MLPYGIASSLVILASTRLEQRNRLHFPVPLVKLGDASYVLYLIHFPVLSFELKLLRPIVTRLHLPLLLVYALAILGAILCSLAVHEWFERRILASFAKTTYRRFAFK